MATTREVKSMTDTLLLTAVIGGTGKTGAAHLVRQVLSSGGNEKTGLITSRHSFVLEKSLPPPPGERWREKLSNVLDSMARMGCTHVVLVLPETILLAGEAEGLELETAIITGLTGNHTIERCAQYLRAHAKRLVCNLDDENARRLAQRWQGLRCTYAERRIEADLAGRNLRLLSDRTEFEALTRTELLRVRFPVAGGYELYQALAALACGLVNGLPLSRCAAALADAAGVPGRMELHQTANGSRVLIDSASTPDALENLLLTARNMTQGELSLVVGASAERSPKQRRELGLVCRLADRIYLTADDPGRVSVRWLSRELRLGAGLRRSVLIPDRSRAITRALAHAGPEDLVVLAGRGDKTTMRVGDREIPFDERSFLAE